jgi:LPXTG-motif cell wall-anchored protein
LRAATAELPSMYRKIFYTTLSIFIYTGWPLFSAAQNKTTVKASVDKNYILIGERIALTLEADIPEQQPIRFFSIDSIDHFEFIYKGKPDTVNTSTGTSIRWRMLLTSFDSGLWVIPAFILDKTTGIQTDSLVIHVGFAPFDPSKPYNDIKDIIEVEVKEKKDDNWYYLAGAGAILFLLLLYFLTRKRKKKPAAVIPENPFTDAMKELELLKKEKPASKEFYTRLIDIFKTYVAKRKNISSLQKTTDELVTQLRSLNMDKEQYTQLSQVLRLSDFVKFARYQPTTQDDSVVFDTIKNAIQTIEKIN